MRNYLFIFLIFIAGCSKETLTNSNVGSNNNGTGGSLARFTLAGNYLYVVEDELLKTFELTDPANPQFKNSVRIGNGIETIYPYRNKLFIGSQTGMYIYSLTDPAQPAYEGEARHVRSCDPVVANDTAAFVTLRGSGICGAARDGLYIYNVRDLSFPQLLQTVDLSTPYGLGLKGSSLFVCRGINGLSVFNVADVNSPQIVRTFTGEDYRDVIPYNDLLICYVADGIVLYDISNAANPGFIQKIAN